MSFVVAIVGAESTGKSTLASTLADHLRADTRRVAKVDEYLREFCAREARTPRHAEQAGIAAEQTRRIVAAAAAHDVVIADTTALMTAVYSELVFDDASLYPAALRDHAQVDLTLLTALDLPWIADGLQRDGPQVRGPVDRALRTALTRIDRPMAVIAGTGPARLAQALQAVSAARRAPPVTRSAWRHLCARCGDGDCEYRLLRNGLQHGLQHD